MGLYQGSENRWSHQLVPDRSEAHIPAVHMHASLLPDPLKTYLTVFRLLTIWPGGVLVNV